MSMRLEDFKVGVWKQQYEYKSFVADFVRLGILEETTGYQRNRAFAFATYLRLFGGQAGAAELRARSIIT